MQLFILASSLLLGLAMGAPAPVSAAAIDSRQTAPAQGTCSTVTNQCTIVTPAGLAGLQVNCAYGGGIGPIFPGHNCTATGNPCTWSGLFGPVNCT
ncbi:hypothetical protein B0T26DRAFT_694658 [Lasiosphaeria miniovina]|uniref:Uncharacterized protein n=1 Tax=Lasiosphaeria miniovina TaxID=1954250 RepID=A0AA40E829_9PEZI|nr:uncharacterized protein B0T26DRAFT_694658 [Lasiosphaeria miniovina]KAK0727461.1 hypothetical protein B0T26DRAFT_694658 [Lasiosphaeria miniovina]